jgi:uncharacterized protein YkwD
MGFRLSRSSRPRSHSLLSTVAFLVVWLVSSVSVFAPSAAYAADASDTASSVIDTRAASYLDQLLVEINIRREKAGNGPLVYAPVTANVAVSQYLSDLTPLMVAMHSCFHGNNNPVSPSWDYVTNSGFGGKARGEVLACPGDNGFWTAPKIADGWWNSPSHWRSLYGDSTVNAVACGTFGPQNGGRAYQTIACVTYRV